MAHLVENTHYHAEGPGFKAQATVRENHTNQKLHEQWNNAVVSLLSLIYLSLLCLSPLTWRKQNSLLGVLELDRYKIIYWILITFYSDLLINTTIINIIASRVITGTWCLHYRSWKPFLLPFLLLYFWKYVAEIHS